MIELTVCECTPLFVVRPGIMTRNEQRAVFTGNHDHSHCIAFMMSCSSMHAGFRHQSCRCQSGHELADNINNASCCVCEACRRIPTLLPRMTYKHGQMSHGELSATHLQCTLEPAATALLRFCSLPQIANQVTYSRI
jgi:hypothetical protein